MKKFNRIFSLVLVLALLASCLPTVFAAEKKNEYTVDDEELIVADWLWGSVIDERGADVMMKEYAEAGFTDIYLLLKGTGGSTSWNSSVPGSNNTYSYDLLQSVLDAARPYGIRIHAWLMAAHDKAYMSTHPNENYYHFRVGYSNSVNQYVNLRGENYRNYFIALVEELCANYPDLAGIHLDTIRYGGIYYDWGADAREVLINKYGITKAEYNAAAKAMCVQAEYTSCTTNSEGYVIYGSGTSVGSTYFSSAYAGTAGSTDAKNGAKKVAQMRFDTVNDFVKLVADAAPGKIISTAIMPDTSIDGAYNQVEYGQQPRTMAPLVDYICTMSYASTYGQDANWPKKLCEAITNVGGNVVAAIQYFPNEDGSATGPSNQRIYDEIHGVMQLRDSVNNDTNPNTGKVLGYAIFRAGFGVYAGVQVNDKDNTLEIRVSNNDRGETTGNTKYPITKLVITMLDGVTVESISNKQGWGNATFTTSSDKKTITISGSFLSGVGSSTFTVKYNGTVNEVTGAAKMDATNSYGRVYTVCNTIMNYCAHEYAQEVVAADCTNAGKITYTCALCEDTYTETIPALGHAYEESFDEATQTKTYTCANCGHTYDSTCNGGHARVETWAETDKTHTAFCYNCEVGYVEGCHFVETARVEATCTTAGSITYTCAGTTDGVHDAYSGMGCGNTYTEVIPAGHSYGTSTDNGDGTHTATCAKCGEKVTEKHTEKVLEGKAATCTEAGLTEGKVCTTCNAVIVAQEVIPETGHTEEIIPAVAATCTVDGSTEGKICSVCEEVLVAPTTITAPGHVEVVIPGTPATCISAGVTDTIYCDTCGETLQAQTVIPAGGHTESYIYEDEDGHIVECSVCFFSKYVEHEYVDGACVCGATIAAVVDNNIKFNHTLNLASDISVQFVIQKDLLAGYDMNTAYVEASINNYEGNKVVGVETFKLQPTLVGNYYYFAFNGVGSTQMNDEITAVFHGTKNGTAYVSNADVYSVATYAYAQMNKATAAAELKALCADLLRYGATSQTYKSYRTNALADAKMTAAHKALLSDINAVEFDNINKTTADIAGATVTWGGKSLALDSKVIVKYVVNLSNYSGNISDLVLKINYTDIAGEKQTVDLKNPTVYDPSRGFYAFDFDGLLAAELRQTISCAVYSGNTRLTSILQYSASTYGNNKTGSLLDLCKALMAYSDSAKAYFG